MYREPLPIITADSVYFARMILKTLNLATILVVAWLLWQQAGLRQEQSALIGAQAGYQSVLAHLSNKISAIDAKQKDLETKAIAAPVALAAATPKVNSNQSAEINGLKAEIANYKGRITKLNKTSELKQTLATVMEAEFAKLEDSNGAAETLLSTKEVIWRSSTEHNAVEQTLQSLMAPIDILAGEWKEGYTDNTVDTIHSVLSRAIAVLESEGTTQR